MIIFDRNSKRNSSKFCELEAGDVFKYENHVYCVLDAHGSGFNVIDFTTFGLDFLYPHDNVIRLEGALEIWDKEIDEEADGGGDD